jgi:hypothetical protein
MYAEGQWVGVERDMYPGFGQGMCHDQQAGYGCTREAGHRGNHRAGTDIGKWCAEWDDNRSTDVKSGRRNVTEEFFSSIGL